MKQNNFLDNDIAGQIKVALKSLDEKASQAQSDVTKYQEVVDALTAKLDLSQTALVDAENQKAIAFAKQTSGTEIKSLVNSLVDSAVVAKGQTEEATFVEINKQKQGMSYVSELMVDLTNQLIVTVELINVLTLLVNQQKSNHRIIPESLLTSLSNSTIHGQKAVADTLTALESCYAAETTLLSSQKSISLCVDQAKALQKKIVAGKDSHNNDEFASNFSDQSRGILVLLDSAYDRAKKNYHRAEWENKNVIRQLAFAQEHLDIATTRLASYQASSAAVTAAGYAA